jgi:PAS domain-containing protein
MAGPQSFMPRTDPFRRKAAGTALRYGLAVSIAASAVALRYWLTRFLGQDNPYLSAYVAVVLAAWFCGLGPSILATIVSLFGVTCWLLPPSGSATGLDRTTLWGMAGFLGLSAMIVALGEALRRANAQQERTEDALRESESRLQALQNRTLEAEGKTAQTMEEARLVDLVNDAVFVRTPDDKVSYWNHGAERLYGWTASEAVGRSPQELVRTVFPIPFSEIAESEFWEGELLQTRRDGSRITVPPGGLAAASSICRTKSAAELPASCTTVLVNISPPRKSILIFSRQVYPASERPNWCPTARGPSSGVWQKPGLYPTCSILPCWTRRDLSRPPAGMPKVSRSAAASRSTLTSRPA